MASSLVKIAGDVFRLAIEKGVPAWRPEAIESFPSQVSQADVTEAQLPISKRPSITVNDLSGGFGQGLADATPTQYDRVGDAEMEGIDATLQPEGPIILAPAAIDIRDEDPALPATHIQAMTGRDSTGNLYFIMGNNGAGSPVWRYSGSAYSERNASTVTATGPADFIWFQGTQGSPYWFRTANAGLGGAANSPGYYSTDSGTTWTVLGTGGGLANVYCMVVADDEVVVAMLGMNGSQNTRIARFQDGGISPTIYGVIDPIGEPSTANGITKLLYFAGRVVIVKQREGLFVLAADRSSLTQNLLPHILYSGQLIRSAAVWKNVLWVCTSNQLLAFHTDFSYVDVTPNTRSAAPRTGSRGVIFDIEGDAYNLYAMQVDETTNTGWLLKANVIFSGGRVSEIAWHQLLYLGSCSGTGDSKGMFVSATQASGGFLKHLFVSFDDAVAGVRENRHIRLPGRGSDPREDSRYKYATAGTLYYPRLDARFSAINKDWLGVTPRTADLGYSVDAVTAVSSLGIQVRHKPDTTPPTSSAPYNYSTTTTQGASDTVGSRIDISGLRARGVDLAVRFSTALAFSQHSPQLFALTADYRPAPVSVWQHQLRIELGSGAYADDGSGGYGAPLPPDAAYRKLRTLPNKAPFEFVDPMGNTVTVFCPSGGVRPVPTGMPEEGVNGALPLVISVLLVETVPASEETR